MADWGPYALPQNEPLIEEAENLEWALAIRAHRALHEYLGIEEDIEVKEINFGPVANPDGSPTELTKMMLAGTGRDPEEFATKAGFGPVTVITADGTGQAMLHEDDHLEMLYEDRFQEPDLET